MTTSAIDNKVEPTNEHTTPVKRKAVLEMSLAETTALVTQLQERRFALNTFIQRARNKNSTKQFESLHNKTEIAINLMNTKLLRVKATLTKIDEDINKVRVLLLEMGECIDREGNDV